MERSQEGGCRQHPVDDGSGLSKERCEFNGWNTAADQSGADFDAGEVVTEELLNLADPVTHTITLYAKWKDANLSYTLKLDPVADKGGSGSLDELTFTTETTELSIPSGSSLSNSAHRVFIGWNTAADGSGVAFQPGNIWTDALMDAASDKTVILYAQWKDPAPLYVLLLHDAGNAYENALAISDSNYGQFTISSSSLSAEREKELNELLNQNPHAVQTLRSTSSDQQKWIEITLLDEFGNTVQPGSGATVNFGIPYPSGTDKDFTFYLIHMEDGTNPVILEEGSEFTKNEDGLVLTMDHLSPFLLAWENGKGILQEPEASPTPEDSPNPEASPSPEASPTPEATNSQVTEVQVPQTGDPSSYLPLLTLLAGIIGLAAVGFSRKRKIRQK